MVKVLDLTKAIEHQQTVIENDPWNKLPFAKLSMPPISLKDIPNKEIEEEDKGPELKMNIFIQKV